MSRHAFRVPADGPEPAWEVARLFPPQGVWDEGDYLALPGNRLVELDRGRVEVLSMPSELHQLLVAFLYRTMVDFVSGGDLGVVLFAPFPVKLWEGKIREPDICFMRREHAGRRKGRYWESADLVMEVMSPNDPERDTVVKRREYAQAGIPEYWLVDPEARTVKVLVLRGDDQSYSVEGVFGSGERAGSVTLQDFAVDVGALLSQ